MTRDDTFPVATGVTDQRLASVQSWNLGALNGLVSSLPAA